MSSFPAKPLSFGPLDVADLYQGLQLTRCALQKESENLGERVN